ncbi:MAG: hypothetical protein HYZ03_04950 [candidate division NC10 bacterium]|nr:hypothetical protein [candidate division NC10 bacterium]
MSYTETLSTEVKGAYDTKGTPPMSLSWIDISLLTLLICLAAVLMAHSLMYLNRRDAQEVRQNRQATCRRHEWVKQESAGLICHLCGKIPG